MRSPRAIITLVLLGLVLASVLNPNAEPTVQAQGKYTVYLPITRAAASAVTPPSGAGAQATFWLPYTQPDQSVIATSAPSIAVDGRGGVHIAYKVAAAAGVTTWPAYYTYCASDCASPARW